MTQKQISEGDKLIVEFLGGKYLGKEKMAGEEYDMFDIPASFPIKLSNPDEFGMKRTGYLAFHSSWDWLISVVEKIQDIDIMPAPNYKGYRIEIVVQGYVKIEGSPMPPIFKNVSKEGSLINAVWAAVVQFIQWYNNTQNKPE